MPITLSELNRSIQSVIEGTFSNKTFDLIAEIGQVNIKKESKVAYLDLVEKGTKSGEFIARSAAQIWGKEFETIQEFERVTGVPFQSGITVLLKINVHFHSVYGLKINVLNVDPNYTLGALAQAKENTILRLLEKYPDKIQRINGKINSYNQSLPLPRIIQKIALITGAQAEGGIDFVHELSKNAYGYQFDITPFIAIMQGEKSPESIRQQLIQIFQSKKKFDVIVMVRGGGASLDLNAFDQYHLIEAMIRFPIPILTGIGHTRNVSLADEVAHTHLKSPTKVAEVIVQHQRNFEQEIVQTLQRLSVKVQDLIQVQLHLLKNIRYDVTLDAQEKLNQHHQFLNGFLLKYQNTAQGIIRSKETKIIHLSLPLKIRAEQKIQQESKSLLPIMDAMNKYFHKNIANHDQKLNSFWRFIEYQHPKKWMAKGFALLRQQDKIVTKVQQLNHHAPLIIELQDGIVETQITQSKNYGE